MRQRLSDAEIQQLLHEPKQLPPDYRELLRFRVVQLHKRASLEIRGAHGSEFRIMIRQAVLDPLNFSVILAYEWREAGRSFLLCRYNGMGHEHQNKLEAQPPFYGYHIHIATERYQRSGSSEEHYAVPTDRYVDYKGAFECLLKDCRFLVTEDPQTELLSREVL